MYVMIEWFIIKKLFDLNIYFQNFEYFYSNIQIIFIYRKIFIIFLGIISNNICIDIEFGKIIDLFNLYFRIQIWYLGNYCFVY